MGRHQDEVRERMDRDADIARGLGGMLGPADLRYYGEQFNYAALADSEMHWGPSPEELEMYALMNAEQERMYYAAAWRNWRGAAGSEGSEEVCY